MSAIVDIPTNARFGKLVVTGMHPTRTKEGRVQWQCKCDCGNPHVTTGKLLRSGLSQSCGCTRAEKAAETGRATAPNDVGKIYGKLTVLAKVYPKAKVFHYRCLCECGNETVVSGTLLRNGSVASCGSWACSGKEPASTLSDLPGPRDQYLAGNFDGEGCITFCKTTTQFLPEIIVKVAQCYKPTSLEYQQYFGGSVKMRDIKSRRPNNRVIWIWTISSRLDIVRFLRRMLPHLTEKKPQAELALKYLDLRFRRKEKDAGDELRSMLPRFVEQMSSLKKFEYIN